MASTRRSVSSGLCCLLCMCIVVAAHKKQVHTPQNQNGQPVSVAWAQLQQRLKTGQENLAHHHEVYGAFTTETDNQTPVLLPDQPAQPFKLFTLNGIVEYPSALFADKPMIFHAFDNHSAFLECLWTSEDSLQSLVSGSPNNTHFVFLPTSDDPLQDALWMRGQIANKMQKMGKLKKDVSSLLSGFHFVTTSLYQLGNWIPALLQQWACQDHGCGLPQAVFQNSTLGKSVGTLNPIGVPIVLKRLDARYDWLPSPDKFGNQTIPVAASQDGCKPDSSVAKKIAVVTAGGCSFSQKVATMEQSSATGVIVYADLGQPVQDMNCEGAECDAPPSIPATMVPYNQDLVNRLQTDNLYVSFQTTPTENYYFGINGEGLLAEMGWLLYPTFQFFNWQAEWFNYKSTLLQKLKTEALVIPVIDNSTMQGDAGVVKTIQLPTLEKLSQYNKLELDASLSCPGTKDESCPPWDHTVNLYLCCNGTSPLCNMELGRWITPFRRRIGRWLTDVSPLFPLINSNMCTFTMKTVPWAKAWKPSLNLRFSKDSTEGLLRPYKITPLFRGGTFNKSYNQNYKPHFFTVPADVKKVQVYAAITGHGSDNNGCGEFCVTSHHFVVNGHYNNITFSNAGTALGCALRTPTGVEPNEHGTWLYGRDGWCDGREVDPWVFNVTAQLTSGQNNITYFGWFEGKDPNPTENPGYIIMYSYLVFYK
ncbi:uncharacterized protein LOC119729686 isoform X2 [Patiria miniata]|uniref:Peptide-N-glycosidase F N-terminal domain-containing protein n=1 Tax=Patiria miniata TaxID=46514 RepID=A0A914A382_PATMI|nr:uncharacterized protein LOC119729686 isoform X2 [Patiria miniata]